MSEEKMPIAGLTLGKVKQFMKDNFIAYTIKKANSGLILGEYEWDVKAKEEIDDERSQKRNYRLYTKGEGNDAIARWEKNQCPILHPPPTPEPLFSSKVEAYIKTQVDSGVIKFGFVVQLNESQKKALCNAIMQDKTDKTILVTETSEGVFSFEVLQ